jgi:Crp-like helix-turn-helix domain
MLQSQRLSTPNRILASLSPGDFGSLAPYLDPVEFAVRHVFFRPHEPIKTVVSRNYGAAMKQSWPLADVLLKFAYAFLIQVTHSALAHSSFKTQQRLARWLLMAQDRVDGDEIPLTHEFLAMMLGTRRASVTEALNVLEKRGTIECKRGRILVRDRPGLEIAAGDCYGPPESELARVGLLGPRGISR